MDEELYIRIVNGRPVDHPMLRSNIAAAFPEVDFDNLPDWLARFERIAKPVPGIYEIVNGPIYVVDGNVVKDQWILRPMTEDEKLIKQNRTRQNFVNDSNGQKSTWVFDEERCCFVPPVPYPLDMAAYEWSESGQTWVPTAIPTAPEWIEGPGGIRVKPHPITPGTYEWNSQTEEWVKLSDDPPESGRLNIPLPDNLP